MDSSNADPVLSQDESAVSKAKSIASKAEPIVIDMEYLARQFELLEEKDQEKMRIRILKKLELAMKSGNMYYSVSLPFAELFMDLFIWQRISNAHYRSEMFDEAMESRMLPESYTVLDLKHDIAVIENFVMNCWEGIGNWFHEGWMKDLVMMAACYRTPQAGSNTYIEKWFYEIGNYELAMVCWEGNVKADSEEERKKIAAVLLWNMMGHRIPDYLRDTACGSIIRDQFKKSEGIKHIKALCKELNDNGKACPTITVWNKKVDKLTNRGLCPVSYDEIAELAEKTYGPFPEDFELNEFSEINLDLDEK